VRMQPCLFVVAILVCASGSFLAELPGNYLKRWDDPAVQQRLDDGIERHRKSDMTLTIVDASGKPVGGAKVKITQTSHEFLFG
jgi:hypothetical protein